MINIYYSVDDAIDAVQQQLTTTASTRSSGWGHYVEIIRSAIEKYGRSYGLQIVGVPVDADIELYVGQPPFKLYPHMHPNLQCTMIETTGLPPSWRDGLNLWDAVGNPSWWGVQSFKPLIDVPVFKIPVLADIDRFPLLEREASIQGRFNYLTMGVTLNDRKNVALVADAFNQGKMPADTHLTVKCLPTQETAIAGPQTDQLYIICADISFASLVHDIFQNCHVMVSPSTGEGIGMNPIEFSLTGGLSIVSKYSGFCELLQSGYALPISGEEVDTRFILYGGKEFKPNPASMIQRMLWAYENRGTALAYGRATAAWIRQKFSPEVFVKQLQVILEHLVDTIDKQLLTIPEVNCDMKWIQLCR